MGTAPAYDPALARARAAVQHVFLAATLIVAPVVLLGMPEARSSTPFWAGCVVVVAATGAAVALRRSRPPHPWWLAVPALDLVGVALMRADLMPTMAAVAVLAALPAMWLGADFGRTGVVVAAAGGLLVFLVPALGPDDAVSAETGLSRLLLWQGQTAGLALLAHTVVVELRRRDVLGRTILNAVGSGVVVYDERHRLLLANGPARAVAELGGYDLAHPERAGDRVWRDGAATAVPAEEQALARACRSEHLPDALEWLGPPRDPSAVAWNARRMRDDHGRVLGTVVVCHDVTGLLSARRSQERFLGTVSHELRTPLTSILGYVDVAESLVSEDDRLLRRSLTAIRANSDRLAALVGQLLDGTREHVEPEPERVDLSALLTAVLDRWRGQCADLGLRLQADVGQHVVADVDPHQISRVADALMSNAAKFTPSGGDVRVRLSNGGRHVLLQVADTGVGMSTTDRERAFDRFHRGDAARVEAVQGVGLGLLTVKKIVEAHHGTVDVDSAPGAGTTVTVRVPAARRS
ncbi:sensor histidine kinase [Nocardioides aquiterrae]|uniref:histidine kinase n=1 Tax=Nocardioides aquiterrae TaxID=203799 RepID=A0ABP4FBA5_9ACTN